MKNTITESFQVFLELTNFRFYFKGMFSICNNETDHYKYKIQ